VPPHQTPKARIFAYLKKKSVSTLLSPRCELEESTVCDETKSENIVNDCQSSFVNKVTVPISGDCLDRKICTPNYSSGNGTLVKLACYGENYSISIKDGINSRVHVTVILS